MSYIICFWDKSKIQVNEIIGEKLKQAIKEGRIEHFELGQSLFSVKEVAKIVSKDEAYAYFPSEFAYLNTMEDRKPNEETLKKLETPKFDR